MTGFVLLDNTVLTNFALVNKAELVLNLWTGAACTTVSVLAEYEAGVSSGLPPGAWEGLPLVALTDQENEFVGGLPPRLGSGERTCLAVALFRQGLFVTDDLDARNVARQYGVLTTGTLGILVLGVRWGILSLEQANILLAEMIEVGYRSPVSSLEVLLAS